ncbi:MAG: hypothetical protein H6Q76_2000 [Firmicutes bacterium]|nr:hypothetical protein [Bacillota bacterium]
MVPCLRIATREPSPTMTPVSLGNDPALKAFPPLVGEVPAGGLLLETAINAAYSAGGEKISRVTWPTVEVPCGIIGVLVLITLAPGLPTGVSAAAGTTGAGIVAGVGTMGSYSRRAAAIAATPTRTMRNSLFLLSFIQVAYPLCGTVDNRYCIYFKILIQP